MSDLNDKELERLAYRPAQDEEVDRQVSLALRELRRRRAESARAERVMAALPSAERLRGMADNVADAHILNWDMYSEDDPPTGDLQEQKRNLDLVAALLRSIADALRSEAQK